MRLNNDTSLKEAILKAKESREKEIDILNKALDIIKEDANWETMLRVQSII